MNLPERKDVPGELTWDLSHIYDSEEKLQADLKRVQEMGEEIAEKYQGKLDTAKNVADCLDEMQQLEILLDHIGNYCDLAVSVNYYDNGNQQRMAAVDRIRAELRGKISFVESELSQAPDEVLSEAIIYAPVHRLYLERLLENKPHRLHPQTEEALARLSGTLEAPYELYQTAKLADMRFEPFTVDGREYPLGYSLFEDDYEYDSRTEVRRGAFAAFSGKIKEYENVTGAVYNAQVQKEKTMASLRGFDSVIDSLLFSQQVPRELYDRQIDVIMEKLAPHMRKYAGLIQRVNHLDRMTFADLKAPIDGDYDPRITIQEAEEYLARGLSVLGEDYVDMVHEAFRDRWIDFAKNQGKETGGFCASPYRKNSYILLSWNDRMSDVLTLAHELGHAGFSRASSRKQPFYDATEPLYVSEAPSTTNEIIMAHYLLRSNPDKRFRRWVLSCMITNTYYHNFVTHLLEAAYQREVYRIVDQGGSVQAETLSRIMRETLEKFWGDAVELSEGAELTWMRQPHYYMGLYSYTYSAGLTIGTQVCRRIEQEGQAAVDDWKKVLGAGSTLKPIEFAAAAGVDITTEKPLVDTIDYIGEIINEIIRLTDELEAE